MGGTGRKMRLCGAMQEEKEGHTGTHYVEFCGGVFSGSPLVMACQPRVVEKRKQERT